MNDSGYPAFVLGEQAIKVLLEKEVNIPLKMISDPITYIKENRTIGIVSWRQSGKSSYLEHKQSQAQSILFVPKIHKGRSNRNINIYEFQEITSIASKFYKFGGEPFKYFLVDDSSFLRGDNEYDFWQFVGFMSASCFLAPDFFVLKMTT